VAGALRYYEGQHYTLHTWTIMPNHVHVLFTVLEEFSLSKIVHSWKSFTANQGNRLLQRFGRFWQPEYYDRLIRNERQFEFTFRYILTNPVKAAFAKKSINGRGPVVPRNWFR
jgi:REP element-mobilizing transposase RayT